MTIEKRPNATADKNAPTQAPTRAPVTTPGIGPKLPGPPGVPGTERFRLLAYVKQESMVRVDKRPDETVLTWPHLLRAEFVMSMLITGLLIATSVFIRAPLEEIRRNIEAAGFRGHQAPAESCGARQQRDRDRQLHRDQQSAEALASGHGRPAFPQRRVRVEMSCPEHRDRGGTQTGDGGHPRGA